MRFFSKNDSNKGKKPINTAPKAAPASRKDEDPDGSTRVLPKMKEKSAATAAAMGGMLVPRTKPRSFALGVTVTTLKMLFVALLIFGIAGMGALFGVASAYVETSPIVDTAVLTDISRTSLIYDKDGKEIAKYTGSENRIWSKIDDMPQSLKDAFVSIEDTRFYSHEGIDLKRLFGAFVGNLQSSSVQGGSTISQQLVKLRMLTSERSYKRKIQEAYMTMILEKEYSKDQILEAYMNTILLGANNYGVQAAANDYFGKDVKDLTIRECAMLAGITQSPNRYNPRKNYYTNQTPEIVDDRTDIVLGSMYSSGRITKEQYEQALAEQVKVQEQPAEDQKLNYAYFIEYAVKDIIDNLIEQRKLENTTENRAKIEEELRTQGYKIYLTIDPNVQNTVQETLANYKNYPTTQKKADAFTEDIIGNDVVQHAQPEASATVLDYHTGEWRAIVGGRNLPTAEKQLNRAYQSTDSVGSSIKPIAVYGPAIDMGMSPNTLVNNTRTTIPGWNSDTGYPTDHGPSSYMTMREAIVQSYNRAAARTLLEKVTLDTSAQYLQNLGVDPTHISMTPSGLALGTSPITPLEMSAAFGAIANEGVYVKPISFTKVEDKDGKVILDGKALQEGTEKEAFKKSTAYILTDILQEAIQRGTGTAAKLRNMTVAGKTGTNNDSRGISFTGYTPYYCATVHIGHDENKALNGGSSTPIFKIFMDKIHEGLENKPIMEGNMSDFGLSDVSICSVSGKLATEACSLDINGHLPTNALSDGENKPTQTCNVHSKVSICAESQHVATENCPNKVDIAVLKSGEGVTSGDVESYMQKLRSRYPNLNIEDSCELHKAGAITTTSSSNFNLSNTRIEVLNLLNSTYRKLNADRGQQVSYDYNKVTKLYNELNELYNNSSTSAATLVAKMNELRAALP